MIPYSRELIQQDDIDAVISALNSTHLTQGLLVDEFESALCEYTGAKYALVMNSATSALYCAYKAIGLQGGDEAITTPITFAATSNMLLACGAKPIFCDVKRDGNIDESKLDRLINKNTKTIVPVDFGGNPVEIGTIIDIAQRNGLKVIRDASHALGSLQDGIKVGVGCDVTIFSFHAIKPITTGEGGALLTNDEEIYQKAKLLRSHGITKKALWNSDMSELGFNFRLSDINCALGVSQLKKLDRFISVRDEIASFYDKRFEGNPYFETIKIAHKNRSARHLYPIILRSELWCPKEDIFGELHSLGIGVQVHYKPTYQFSYYKERFGEMYLSGAEDFYRAELSIPCYQAMSLKDAEFVAETILQICKKYDKGQCGR